MQAKQHVIAMLEVGMLQFCVGAGVVKRLLGAKVQEGAGVAVVLAACALKTSSRSRCHFSHQCCHVTH